MEILGGCHCGNVKYQLQWLPDSMVIPARQCSCSFCTKHGAVWTSCPAGSLHIDIKDPQKMQAYEFSTRTTQFQICTQCGVVPFSTCMIEQRLYAVVNTSTFEPSADWQLNISPMSFDNEDVAVRLSRRQRSWISNIVYMNGTSATP